MFGFVVAFVRYTCHTLRAKYQIILMVARFSDRSFVHHMKSAVCFVSIFGVPVPSTTYCIFIVRASFFRCQIAMIECNYLIASAMQHTTASELYIPILLEIYCFLLLSAPPLPYIFVVVFLVRG